MQLAKAQRQLLTQESTAISAQQTAQAQAGEVHEDLDFFQGQSGIRRWLLWLFVLLVLSVGITTAYFLNDIYEGSINAAMYLVIGVLGVSLIIKNFSDARFLQVQTDLASEQLGLLEVVDNFEDFLKRSRPSIFRKHIQNLYIISQSQSDISQDNLIELLHSRLSARNKIVELFASVLIRLGLIGTILGLILMMGGLIEVMDGAVVDENLMSALVGERGPLSGLGVAFITTLLGAVLGGVVLRVLTSIVDANTMEYTAHIAELTEVYVLPHLRKTARAAELADAAAQ